MATTPTSNDVPSESPRDLKFNSGKIDEFVTSFAKQYIDRFGNAHYTIEGLRDIATQIIARLGWITVKSFQDGATLTLPNEVLYDESTGEYYRWDGDLPKTVPSGSTPETSGGIGAGAWVSVGDASLRANIASDDDGMGDALIGVKQPVNGAVARTQHDKNADVVSVKDFGAKGDGSDDTASFQAAYDAVSANSVIIIPAGTYAVSAVTGTKSVVWESIGGKPSSGALFDLPGIVWNRYENSTIVDSSNPGDKDSAPLRARKICNYTGGTSGYVNAVLQADSEVKPGGTSYEWVILGKLESYRTATDASEDCASYFQATKYSSGKTWGQVVELIDKTADPTVSSVSQELDVRATGLDSNSNRILCHMVTTSTNGTISSVGYGLKQQPDDLAPIDKLWGVVGSSYNYLVYSNTYRIDKYGAVTTDRTSTESSGHGSFNYSIDGSVDVSLQAIGNSQWGIILDDNLSYVAGISEFRPHTDGDKNLGSPTYRWSTVYATTGTINTSDERAKTFSSITDAEYAAAKEIKSLFNKFQFNSAITEKGVDKARYHFGVGAQSVRKILVSNGLDPDMYGFLCYDEWDDIYEDTYEDQDVSREVTGRVKQDDNTYKTVTVTVSEVSKVKTGKTLVKPAGNMYGIRYEELLCFIISAI